MGSEASGIHNLIRTKILEEHAEYMNADELNTPRRNTGGGEGGAGNGVGAMQSLPLAEFQQATSATFQRR